MMTLGAVLAVLTVLLAGPASAELSDADVSGRTIEIAATAGTHEGIAVGAVELAKDKSAVPTGLTGVFENSRIVVTSFQRGVWEVRRDQLAITLTYLGNDGAPWTLLIYGKVIPSPTGYKPLFNGHFTLSNGLDRTIHGSVTGLISL